MIKSLLVSTMTVLTSYCHPQVNTPVKPVIPTIAFCGVHPDDPYAEEKVASLAKDSGFFATAGPCLRPDWSSYSPAFPTSRYATPDIYMRLVEMNASVGMKTMVYDARIWSTDQTVVDVALEYWSPVLLHIYAWDMGDEFDPNSETEWGELTSRWGRMQLIAQRTGVQPFTNHLGFDYILEKALQDLSYDQEILSYDIYDEPISLGHARKYSAKVGTLMCAVNTLDHGSLTVTPDQLKNTMQAHITAGCDALLIFGGEMPINTDGFSTPSAVNSNGTPTSLAKAIYTGSR